MQYVWMIIAGVSIAVGSWCFVSVVLIYTLRIESIAFYPLIDGGWEVSIKKGGQ
jgi:hypothetical protein